MSEQHKLVAEKNALIETVKRLNREVARLEHFKRNLLQQLQEDCEVGMQAATQASFGTGPRHGNIGPLHVPLRCCHAGHLWPCVTTSRPWQVTNF